jgi:hypothetical protein
VYLIRNFALWQGGMHRISVLDSGLVVIIILGIQWHMQANPGICTMAYAGLNHFGDTACICHCTYARIGLHMPLYPKNEDWPAYAIVPAYANPFKCFKSVGRTSEPSLRERNGSATLHQIWISQVHITVLSMNGLLLSIKKGEK